jgi:hypothetical protein
MKLQIAKSDLVAACQMASTGAGNSGTEIHNHFLFRQNAADPTKLDLLSNSIRTCALVPLQAVTIVTPGEPFTIDSGRLEKWLGVVKDEALTIEYANKVVSISVPGQGVQRFQSLDPVGFPDFDKPLAASKPTATIKASRLKEALSTARLFAGLATADTKKPETCSVEVQNGVLTSTDGMSSVCFIQAPGLENTNLRVHVKDLVGVTKFLGLLGDGDVTIRDYDRTNFFVGSNGAVFGAQRFQQGPPQIKPPTDTPHYQWSVSRDEMRAQVKFLLPGMPKEESRVTLDRKGGPVILTAQSITGTERITVDVSCSAAEEADKAPAIPQGGVPVSYERLLYLLDSLENDAVTLGVSISGSRKQYIRVSEKHGEDNYILLLAARH